MIDIDYPFQNAISPFIKPVSPFLEPVNPFQNPVSPFLKSVNPFLMTVGPIVGTNYQYLINDRCNLNLQKRETNWITRNYSLNLLRSCIGR